MNLLLIIKKWAVAFTDSILSLIVFSFLFDLLTGSVKIPFSESVDLAGPIVDLLKNIGSKGGAGIVFAWILYSIYKQKK